MEMNRDEANRCKDLGIKYLRAGNYQKAYKFLDKSLKLFPLPGVEALRQRAMENSNSSEKAARSQTANEPDASSSTPSISYTQEQVVLITKIKRCKTHYEVLGVTRDCDENDVKRAYKKLALKLHPDKNSAPGAEDAFKALGKAVSVLGDKDKRAHYDKYGNDENTSNGRQGYHEQEVSPEDIFNMFFGGGNHQRGMYRHSHRGGNHHNTQQQKTGFFQVLQLLPLIVIFFLSFFSYPVNNEQPFSFYQTEKFPIRRVTNTRKVITNLQYFVGSDFDAKYARDWRELSKVEKAVEKMHLQRLEEICYQENMNTRHLMYKARNIANREVSDKLMQEAIEQEKPACDKLRSYGISTH